MTPGPPVAGAFSWTWARPLTLNPARCTAAIRPLRLNKPERKRRLMPNDRSNVDSLGTVDSVGEAIEGRASDHFLEGIGQIMLMHRVRKAGRDERHDFRDKWQGVVPQGIMQDHGARYGLSVSNYGTTAPRLKCCAR